MKNVNECKNNMLMILSKNMYVINMNCFQEKCVPNRKCILKYVSPSIRYAIYFTKVVGNPFKILELHEQTR